MPLVRPALRRAGRRTNAALLALLLASFVTGVLAFGIGTVGPATVVVVAHGAAGLGLLLLVPWKSVVIRRSWPRAAGRRGAGATLGVMVVLLVGSGLLHSFGGFETYLGLTPMQVHVSAAVVAAVALLIHMRLHRGPTVRRTDLSRRTALRAAGLAAGAAVVYAATEAVAPARRATGSHEVGSGDPTRMPITQWFTDPVLDVDAMAWRLRLPGREVALTDLRDGDDSMTAVLDCTNGWYARQEWRGVRLDRLIDTSGARSIDVVSATGYGRRFPMSDATNLLLATHVGGSPLSAGHGAPVRLVAPGRRGFWWVKWVERIEPTDIPWWAASPFPLR